MIAAATSSRRSTARALVATGVVLAGSLQAMTIVTPVSLMERGPGSATVERVRGRCIGCAQLRLGRIQFVTKAEGWATANSLVTVGHGLGMSAIVHTVNGGRSWASLRFVQEAPSGGSEPAFWFTDRDHGWVGWADEAAIQRLSETKDGGQTWSHRVSPLTGRTAYIGFFDEHRGWLVSVGLTGTSEATTQDGGTTWQRKDLPLRNIDCARSSKGNLALVVGRTEGINEDHLRLGMSPDGGVNWSWSDLPAEYETIHDCDLLDQSTVWLVVWLGNGRDSYLVQTLDGGRTWNKRGPDSVESAGRLLTALTFASKRSGLAFVSDSRHKQQHMLTTSDAGDTWQWRPVGAVVSNCQNLGDEVYCAAGIDLLRIRFPERQRTPDPLSF